MEEYEPIKVLGEGSFGKVYLMKHTKTRDLVCTKVVKLKNIPVKDQEACRNEVLLLERMTHPNIVGYTNSFLYKNCLCIIMEYCDAGDLGDRVNEAKGQLLPEGKVMTWFVQTALGLHYMHSNRILHRDIKTQNVFILSTGRVVLGDLGISKLLAGTRDFASTCIGTPYYMSPEIFKNHPYNDKSDVWALGCLLYELLTLKHAFDAQSLNGLAGKIIKGKFPPISGDYSKNLRALVIDMLATNPKKRPDIEQILRKTYVQTRVKEFVSDLDAATLHRQDKTMSALAEQLKTLQMHDAIPRVEGMPTHAEEGDDDDVDDDAREALAQATAKAVESSKDNSRSIFKQQKHQLELEEEKRIAAEMALNRLRRKAAERRRRASVSAPNSPGGGRGVGGSVTPTPASPGGDDGGGDNEMSSPSRNRRPSLLQRLGSLATNPMRKSVSTPGSPSGIGSPEMPGSPSGARRGSCTSGVGGGEAAMSDVDRAMALAVAAAESMEASEKGRDTRGSAVVKGPTGPPKREIGPSRESMDYVSNPTPRRRASKSGVNNSNNNETSGDGGSPASRGGDVSSGTPRDSPKNDGAQPPPSPPGQRGACRGSVDKGGSPRGRGSAEKIRPDSPHGAADGGGGGGNGSGKERRGSQVADDNKDLSLESPKRRLTTDLPKLEIGAVKNGPGVTPPLRSGRTHSPENSGRSYRRSASSMYEEDENDLFAVLKKQANEHASGGEDREVHEMEKELKARLKEAEERCYELKEKVENTRAAAMRRGSASVGPPPPDPPVDPATLESPIGIGVNPVTAGNAGGAGGRRGSISRSRSGSGNESHMLDDRASDFDDDPVPYCESQLEELRDAPTPVGKLVDRVQFLRQKCASGLGEDNFERALDLLRRMQEGDCKVTVDGVEYDGNDDDEVEQMLILVIGKHKLHYWNLLDQLLLMS